MLPGQNLRFLKESRQRAVIVQEIKMKEIDLKDLVVGLMALIGIATGLGQMNGLHDFAARQAARSLSARAWHSYYFFLEVHGNASVKKMAKIPLKNTLAAQKLSAFKNARDARI